MISVVHIPLYCYFILPSFTTFPSFQAIRLAVDNMYSKPDFLISNSSLEVTREANKAAVTSMGI